MTEPDRVVREHEDGCWTFPGGWAELGQSAAGEGIRRSRFTQTDYFEWELAVGAGRV